MSNENSPQMSNASNSQYDPAAEPDAAENRRTRRRRRLRWGVPGVAVAGVAAVAAGAVAVPQLAGASDGPLPQLSAQQLLTRVGSAKPQPLSGTVVESADLGLPALPGSGSSTSLTSLISGSHTLRLWYGSDTQQRVAIQGDLAETDVVRNGNQAWVWSSSDHTAQHLLLPTEATANPSPKAGAEQLTPGAAAGRALAAVQPTTTVSVDPTVRVAGRRAYQLVLRPRTAGSLVDRVTIAVDGTTSIPLRVEVYAVGRSTPSFSTGFTSLSVAAPDSSVFRFDPPAGTKVTTNDLRSAMATAQHPKPGAAEAGKSAGSTADAGKPTVVGSGWSSIVAVPGVDLASAGNAGAKGGSGTGSLVSTLTRSATPVSGSFGTGRVLSTRLFSVLLLNDGRMFVGAVTPKALEQAAAK